MLLKSEKHIEKHIEKQIEKQIEKPNYAGPIGKSPKSDLCMNAIANFKQALKQ